MIVTTDPVQCSSESAIRTIFQQSKEDGLNLVNRLRSWQEGDVVWGYDIQTKAGQTTGSTYSQDDHAIEMSSYGFLEFLEREMMESVSKHGPAVGVVWVGIIDGVEEESHARAELGEPPLKHASIRDVCVSCRLASVKNDPGAVDTIINTDVLRTPTTMTGYKALTTDGWMRFPNATEQVRTKHGVELRRSPDTAISAETDGPVITFFPYGNLIAVVSMEDSDDDQE
jgi:hypothetical protein